MFERGVIVHHATEEHGGSIHCDAENLRPVNVDGEEAGGIGVQKAVGLIRYRDCGVAGGSLKGRGGRGGGGGGWRGY